MQDRYPNPITFLTVTKTAVQAALALGCKVEQIAKSLVFQTDSGEPILIITSGINRVDEGQVAKIINKQILKADADFCKKVTGFTIGGIPPYGHVEKIETYIDEDLINEKEIWAAAGKDNSVFKLTPKELKEKTGGRIIKVN